MRILIISSSGVSTLSDSELCGKELRQLREFIMKNISKMSTTLLPDSERKVFTP